MKNNEMFIKWLELTVNLIQKYNLDNLSVKVESHLVGLDIDKAIYKELLKINIKDESKYLKNKLNKIENPPLEDYNDPRYEYGY